MGLSIIVNVGYFFLSVAVGCIICIGINCIRKRKLNEHFLILVGSMIALGAALLSIGISHKSFKQAEKSFTQAEKAFIQTEELTKAQSRPYLSISDMSFSVKNPKLVRDNDIECEYLIYLKNSGNLPASNVLVVINISFKTSSDSVIRMSTNPTKDEIPIPSKGGVITVGKGVTDRKIEGTLLIDQKDAFDITSGQRETKFEIVLEYSTPEYDEIWKYEMYGEWNGKTLIIIKEELH